MKIPFKTIQNGINNFKIEKSKYWSYFKEEAFFRNTLISYESIPPNSLNRYDLPKSKDEFLLKYQTLKTEKPINSSIAFIELGLSNACNNQWPKYVSFYNQHSLSERKVIQYSKTHAVFEEINQIINLRKNVKSEEIFHAYQNIEELVFKTSNLVSFRRKLRLAKRHGITFALFNKRVGKVYDKKLTDTHKHLLLKYYKLGRYTYRRIKEIVNVEMISKGYSEISLSTVKAYLRLPEVQNRGDYHRYGKKYASDNLIPFLPRERPLYAGDLWEVDSSKAQFMYKDSHDKIRFLVMCFVEDIHSKMIVGFSIDDSENHKMIIQAISRAFSTTGYMPAEVVHDNFSAYKTEEFIN